MADDPFGTAALRTVVLDAWVASPQRFREDANAEERLSLGYAGRVIAELAANGADAAAAAGVPGRIAVGLDGRILRVANTGAPLSAAGVAGLASLRASAKRRDRADRPDRTAPSGAAGDPEGGSAGQGRPGSAGDGAVEIAPDSSTGGESSASVGHFGVGFTAVRAISDEITVVSTTGSVRFSVEETATALRGIGDDALRGEVARRGGQLPALRLPWPAPGLAPADGYATEVRLHLRDDIDIDALAADLGVGSEVGDRSAGAAFDLAADLLWALPGLAEVALPATVVRRSESAAEPGVVELAGPGTAQRFRVRRCSGNLPPELLADRPVEERGRTGWFVTWIVPMDDDGVVRPVAPNTVGAPTPIAERIGVPARLVASLPVDEMRSRIAPGPLTDFVMDRAVNAYGELIRALPAGQRLALIPAPGFPLGEWDARLRERLAAELAHADLLPGAAGQPVAPADALIVPGIDGPAAAAVAEAIPGLVAWPAAVAQVEALRGLGVRIGTLAEVLNAIAMLERPAHFYLPIYDALSEAPPDDLAGLPLPRSGGGTLIGARGVLVTVSASDDGWATQAARLVPGLRIAAPGLDHPLLRRLGARDLDAETLLAAPELAREILRRYDEFDSGGQSDSWDDDGPEAEDFPVLVLGLLAACGSVPPGSAATLSRLLLTDESGRMYPAAELLLPDAPLKAVLADDADLPAVGAHWLDRYGADVLEMLGVRTSFGVARFALPPGRDADLDSVDLWWEDAASGDAAGFHASGAESDGGEEFTAITDLDLVADDAWPQALGMIADDPAARDALRRTAFGPSYSAWWLRHYATLDGIPLGRWRTADAAELAGLYDAVPATLSSALAPDLLAEIGVLRTLVDAAADPEELLARWADVGRDLPAARVPAVTAAVLDAIESAADDEIPLPATVRTLDGGVVDAGGALVLDHPMLAQVLDLEVLVAGGADPSRAAELLDLPLASAETRWDVIDSAFTATTLAAVTGAQRCLDWLGDSDLADLPVTLTPELAVRVTPAAGSETPEPQRVTWWIADGGALHLDGSAHGIARAIAARTDRWADRYLLQTIAGGAAEDLAEWGIDTMPGRGRRPDY